MSLRPSQIAIRYAAFAVVATLANLGVQRAVLAGSGGQYLLALAGGTAVGLAVKYLLDKRWIFHDAVGPLGAESRKFALYAATGIGTTLLFWGSETGFWLVWHSRNMRELGAVLGLTAGYVVKFALDRRFVFVPGQVPPG